LSAVAEGQSASDKTQNKSPVEVVTLTVYPATLPRPVLKYPLLPPLLDQMPGNAAPLYRRAGLLMEQNRPDQETWNEVLKWLGMPANKLPREEVRKVLESQSQVLHEVELGSRRQQCDWDLPFHEEKGVFSLALPELAPVRDIARLIRLRAQLQVAEGDYDGAVRSLQDGFCLAHRIGEQPLFISGLVGLALAKEMTEPIESLMQSPSSPNLYWSLTDLPRPFVDLGEALRLESMTVYLVFPELKEARQATHTPDEWQRLFGEFVATFRPVVISLGVADKTPDLKLDPEQLVEKSYPRARQELIARGRTKEAVDAMPPAQAVLLHTAETWDELRDELFRWMNLPYWQAVEGLRQSEQRLDTLSKQWEVVPLADALMPGVRAVCLNVAVAERHLSVLRCIEAIRLYAATHGGALPKSLDEITEVPVPVNPVTGQPFPYRLEGDTAVLEAKGGHRQQEYRIRLAK
jgi:hypothetical protein